MVKKIIFNTTVVLLSFNVCAYALDSANVVIQEDIKGSTAYDNGIVDFEAKKAVYDTNGSTVELREDVKFKTSEGLELETELIKWDQDKDLVSTDEEVRINKNDPNIDIKGRGMAAKPGLKTVKLENEVEVVIPQEDSKYIVITCDGPLEVSYDDGMAIFRNEVKVSQKDSEIYTDLATIYFDAKTKVLDRIVAEGNVRLIRGKDTSYSEKAVYYAKNKRIVLEGRPRLVIFPEQSQSDPLKDGWSLDELSGK